MKALKTRLASVCDTLGTSTIGLYTAELPKFSLPWGYS